MNSPLAGTVSAAEISVSADVLLPGYEHPVSNATVYSNITALNPAFGRHLLQDIYVNRTCVLAALTLSRLKPGAILFGGDEFLVGSGGLLLQEQVAPYFHNAPERITDILSAWRPVINVAEECLLVARYGIYTWGHWLGELLPKIVAAEAFYPGRFRYLLPGTVMTGPDPNLPTERIRESLRAYKIGRDRILSLYPAMNYQFDRLHTISPIWSDHIIHPGIGALMRSKLSAVSDAPGAKRVCLERIGPGRAISNADDVTHLLDNTGFVFRRIGALPFDQQVRLFQSASVIFAILGSDLSGLIYAPEGIKVISAAPAIFGDRFFYALILDRKGRYADLRGSVTDPDPVVDHRSRFHLDPAEIRSALAAFDEPP